MHLAEFFHSHFIKKKNQRLINEIINKLKLIDLSEFFKICINKKIFYSFTRRACTLCSYLRSYKYNLKLILY